MKKFISLAVSCVLAFGAIAGFAACGGDGDPTTPQPHTHKYAETWSYDKESHWRDATCGDAEGADSVKDEAAHGAPDENGKCPTCGYQIVGMTLEAFKATADYETKIRRLVEGQTSAKDLSGGEFIWVRMDENHKVTELSLLYFGPTALGGERYSDTLHVFSKRDIDLKDVANATATLGDLQGSTSVGGGMISYDKDAQAGKADLANAAVEAYSAHRAEGGFEPVAHILRLCAVSYRASENKTSITVLDVIETGYVIYQAVVPTDAEKTDAELLTLLQEDPAGAECKATTRRANLGTLIYSSVK